VKADSLPSEDATRELLRLRKRVDELEAVSIAITSRQAIFPRQQFAEQATFDTRVA
jgi:hypothetical protein